jgi:AcrR family transcriptional regulator
MAESKRAPLRPRRSDFERNRQRLLSAARQLVAEHGPDALTVSEVAHRAGLNRTTAYQHFRTRDELVSAVLDAMSDELQSGLAEPHSAPELIDRMGRALTDQREIARLALHLLMSGDPLPRRGWGRFVAHLGTVTRGSRTQDGVDAEMLAHILVGTWLVWSLRAHAEYDEAEVPAATARLTRELKRLFLYGLFRPERMPDLVDSLRPPRARKKEQP